MGIGTNNLRAKLPNPKSWHWDRTPSLSDPRLPVLGILILYVVLGITVLGFNRSPLRTNIYVSNVHEKRQAEGSLLWMNAGNVDRANCLRQANVMSGIDPSSFLNRLDSSVVALRQSCLGDKVPIQKLLLS